MSFIELVPAVKELERADKFRLMQFLLLKLAREEGMPLLTADAEYPIPPSMRLKPVTPC